MPRAELQRAVWLKSLRAKCARRMTGTGCDNDLDILRRWVIELFSESGPYPLKSLACRHSQSTRRPDGVTVCRSTGTKDANKAMGIVLFDLKKHLRVYIEKKLGGKIKSVDLADDSDDDDEDFEDGESDDEAQTVRPLKRGRYELPESQVSVEEYPTSSPNQKRVSTKVRVHVLTYLLAHSEDITQFEMAYRQLVQTDNVVLHLCGCGVSKGGNSCVEPTHLELGQQSVNMAHTAIHAALCNDALEDSDYVTLQHLLALTYPGVF